jgi:phosphate uptake regulator
MMGEDVVPHHDVQGEEAVTPEKKELRDSIQENLKEIQLLENEINEKNL